MSLADGRVLVLATVAEAWPDDPTTWPGVAPHLDVRWP